MSNDVIYHKINQQLSRGRSYHIAKYQDGTVMLNLDNNGSTICLHLSKEDVESLAGDFNA